MTQFKGKLATVNFCNELCIGTGECGRAAGDLFVGGRDPWCDPDTTEELNVKNIIERCPSGALTAELENNDAPETATKINSVHVTQNGPYFVRGELELEDPPANAPGVKFRAALCRCGQSQNKPFCDNSHKTAKFTDSGAAGKTGDEDHSVGGKLNIKPLEDASLILTGNVTITAGTGREAWHGSKLSLCRCGASKNKPFCDGSHKVIGFKTT